MTEFNSDQFAKWEATPAEMVEPNELNGELRVARFSFDNTASGATSASANDTIKMTKLPEGSRVLFGELEVTDAFATGATLDIGTSGAQDKYQADLAMDATGVSQIASNVAESGLGSDQLGNTSEDIIGTLESAGGKGAFEGYLVYVAY